MLRADEAAAVEAPFERRFSPDDETGGAIVALPDRGGADNHRGRVVFSLAVEKPGPYFAWVRARWDNECANSLLLHVNDGNGFTVGEDMVFNSWHWVRAGRHMLTAGAHGFVLAGREDGVAVSEVLFTPDDSFTPTTSTSVPTPDLRRVADRFDRSPGHGLDPWRALSGQWEIAFTLDPNRIPDQYALTGRMGTNGESAVALLEGDPWPGVLGSFSFSPTEPGEAGILLECDSTGTPSHAVWFAVSDTGAWLRVEGVGVERIVNLEDRVRLGQWHRIDVERWAWLLRVTIDGRPAFTGFGPLSEPGLLACAVRSGAAVFDDVSVQEVPWQVEDGGARQIPWTVSDGARWFRRGARRGGGLLGKTGSILTGLNGLPVRAVLLADEGGAGCRIGDRSAVERFREGAMRLLEPDTDAGAMAELVAARETAIPRVAVGFGLPPPELFVEGPYHFTDAMMEDPSDYLDFSPEELARTTDSEQADKLLRRPKLFRLVGRRSDGSAWVVSDGRWDVRDGRLTALQPGSVQHWRDINVGLEMRGRVRLDGPGATAGVNLYAEGTNGGLSVRFGTADGGGLSGSPAGIAFPIPSGDGVWREFRIAAEGDRQTASVEGEAPITRAVTRGVGGAHRLMAVSGPVSFDDIQFRVPRSAPGEFFYAFDRRETDWWREGGPWIDHGGISCALASHWISLVAPAGRGVLWNKRTFGSDLFAAFTVEENTEWFGWKQSPSHVHHAYDNICLLMAPTAEWDSGYRLEVNARGRRETVLYRGGQPVVSVAQDAMFPMRYIGGHQPYVPRRNRIALVREGSRLRAWVNGVEVLTYDDADPLPVSRVGVGGYETRANFSHIEIRDLTAP